MKIIQEHRKIKSNLWLFSSIGFRSYFRENGVFYIYCLCLFRPIFDKKSVRFRVLRTKFQCFLVDNFREKFGRETVIIFELIIWDSGSSEFTIFLDWYFFDSNWQVQIFNRIVINFVLHFSALKNRLGCLLFLPNS